MMFEKIDYFKELKSIITETSSAILIVQNSLIQYFNPSAVGLFAGDSNDFQGKLITDYLVSSDTNMLSSILNTNRWEGKNKKFASHIYNADHKVIPVEVEVGPASWKNKPAVFLVIRHDIVQNKKGIQVIERLSQKGSALFFAGPLKSGANFNFFSGDLEKYGYDFNELLNGELNWKELLHPDDRPHIEESVDKMRRLEIESADHELRFLRKDGDIQWFRVFLNLEPGPKGEEGVFGFCVDINKRKRAEKKISSLYEVFNKMGTDPIKNIDLIVRETCTILQGACSLYNRLDDVRKSLIVWSGFKLPDDFEYVYAPEGHICYEATIKGGDSPVIINELQGTEYEKTDPNVSKYQLRSYLGYPVFRGDKAIGSLCIVDVKSREFSRMQVQILATLAKALSIEESRLLEAEKIRYSEEQYRTTIEALSDSVHIIDRNYKVLLCNTSMRQLNKDIGLEPDPMGKNLRDIYSFLEQSVWQEYEYVFEKGENLFSTEKNIVNNSNYYTETRKIPVFEGGRVSRVITVLRDVTEKMESFKALQRSEERFRDVADAAGEFIWEVDTDWNFTYVSDVVQQVMGFKPAEVRGKRITDFVPWESNEKLDEQLKKLTQTQGVFRGIEYECLCSNGKAIWLKIAGKPMLGPQGKLIGFRGVALDNTNNHQIEETIRAKEKAEESDRLKSAFLANMSHEIRTPMNGIIGFANLLAEEELEPDKRKEFLSVITSSGEHLMSLINDIIDLSKIEAGQIDVKIEKFSLKQLILNLFAFYKDYRETIDREHIDLIINIPKDADGLFVESDSFRLRQVLNNLLSNALKFTEQGKVEFGYTIHEESSELEFFVKDTGIGIPADKQDIVFDRFRQSDESMTREYGGTGLGLSISRGLVQLLGGRIWVNSGNDVQGAHFYFTIPYKKSEEPRVYVQKKLDILGGYNWHDRTILVAEDNDTSFLFIRELLKKSNARIIHANNGLDAVNHIRNNPEIDIVLMDINMPIMNGFDATREIRKFNKKIPVIAQTALAMPADKQKCIEAGCTDYITKPLNAQRLFTIIIKYLKRKK